MGFCSEDGHRDEANEGLLEENAEDVQSAAAARRGQVRVCLLGSRNSVPASERLRSLESVRVTFYKLVEKRVSTWNAVRGRRSFVPGTTMALGRGGLPHDLVQLLVEGTLGLDRGFWGSVASGATFRSTGRKRTRPGRAVIMQNRRQLDEAEHVVGDHVGRWVAGSPTPCRQVLDDFDERWRSLGDGEAMVIDWPTLACMGTTSASA